VSQVSSANANLKNKTYSSREETTMFSASPNKTEKRQVRTETRAPPKKYSPEREVIQTHGDMIDIRSQNDDRESYFERGSIMSKKSIQTDANDNSRSNRMT